MREKPRSNEMKVGVLATMILGVMIGFPIASFAGLAPDADGDGVPDVLDNCSTVSNPGTQDCDTEQDGYGNRCDCDLNQTLTCTAGDLNQWNVAANQSPQTNMRADLNCTNSITAGDLNLLLLRTNNVGTDFKSGLSCASAVVNGCPN
jgi:Thrombospondin type 3 repeat